MHSVDWGSVPEWLAGAGALLALIFARSAVRSAQATNKQQAEQLAALERAEMERDQERVARYAARFVCWVTLAYDTDDGDTTGANRNPDERRLAVGLINSNEVPFYRVTIYAGTPLGVTFRIYNFVGPSSGRRIMGRISRAMQEILPDGTANELLDTGLVWVAMTFRDSGANWWSRRPDGVLVRTDSEEIAKRVCRTEIGRLSLGEEAL